MPSEIDIDRWKQEVNNSNTPVPIQPLSDDNDTSPKYNNNYVNDHFYRFHDDNSEEDEMAKQADRTLPRVEQTITSLDHHNATTITALPDDIDNQTDILDQYLQEIESSTNINTPRNSILRRKSTLKTLKAAPAPAPAPAPLPLPLPQPLSSNNNTVILDESYNLCPSMSPVIPVVTDINTPEKEKQIEHSPFEVPTIGISEQEANSIVKETLKEAKLEKLTKFFDTDKWFNSSGETKTSGVPSATTLNARTAKTEDLPSYLLQTELSAKYRNPFFQEERITAMAQAQAQAQQAPSATTTHHLSAKSSPGLKDSIVDWNLQRNPTRTTIRFQQQDQQEEPSPIKKHLLPKKSKPKSKKTFWFIFVLILLISCLGLLLGFCITLYQGTWETTWNYFRLLGPSERNRRLSILNANFGTTTTSSTLSSKITTTTLQLPTLATNHHDYSYNSFQNINSKYQTNTEIKSIMTNPNLKNVFYGINYAPEGVMPPICGVNFDNVLLDIATLSKVTTRIRLYGSHCNQAKLTLDAIKELGVNMTVSLGVWINDNELSNENQFNELEQILSTYKNESLIDSIVVGNEVLLRGDRNATQLSRYLARAKQLVYNNITMTNMIDITTAEFASSQQKFLSSNKANDFTTGLNIYPFFKGIEVNNAMKYTIDLISGLSNIFISEIGWPSEGGRYQKSVASVQNMQIFIDEFLCTMNKRAIAYYWFEAFDEPWKMIYDQESRNWESHWGIFDSNRNLKISIPNCV